ncbi:hypothetical protein [Phyllobacterium sp. SB3]|uniref:hypothetical protein n=1 Tax=Phyllobacterium sp. SB3 TaxID=3156073 RepID=UPI0032AFD79D
MTQDGFQSHIDDEAWWLVFSQDGSTFALSLDLDPDAADIKAAHHELVEMYLASEGF